MNIIFDLDGTILDSKLRLYTLFQELVLESSLTFEQYWKYKQNKTSNIEILKHKFQYSRLRIKKFVSSWMQLIESPRFLELDTHFPHLNSTLQILAQKHTLHLCTARQSTKNTLAQLEKLTLLPHFQQILITQQSTTKEEIIRCNIPHLQPTDWIVGDTGHDVIHGKSLGIRTCAVLTGFISETHLRSYQPDVICESSDIFINSKLNINNTNNHDK